MKSYGKKYITTLVTEDRIRGKFGEPSSNSEMVAELEETFEYLVQEGNLGGPFCLKFDGPASNHVTSVLTHKLAHLYSALAIRDTKEFIEDPESDEIVIAKGTKYEKKVRAKGKLIDGKFVPAPVFVITAKHGKEYFIGQKLSI